MYHRPRIRRDSFRKGTFEHHFFRRVTKEMKVRILRDIEMRDRYSRKWGQRNGVIGHIGLEVVKYLFRVIHPETGHLDPAITTIMKGINRSRDAVISALKRLKAARYLIWRRRTDDRLAETGPTTVQTTNVYRFSLPDDQPRQPVMTEGDEIRLLEAERMQDVYTYQVEMENERPVFRRARISLLTKAYAAVLGEKPPESVQLEGN